MMLTLFCLVPMACGWRKDLSGCYYIENLAMLYKH